MAKFSLRVKRRETANVAEVLCDTVKGDVDDLGTSEA
jgi:hypothetical protein